MGKTVKTSSKRPPKPFRGAVDGVPFTTENQPDPALKSAGWQEWRKERHLTQSIIKALTGENKANFDEYITSLISNAKAGNPKAIDAVNKCIEDDILKVEHSGEIGSKVLQVEIIPPVKIDED